MILPKFLHCTSDDIPGAGLLLSTSAPYALGKVLKFLNPADLSNFLYARGPLALQVPGYNIGIEILETLDGTPAPITILPHMANFYLTSKILTHERYYARYKTNQ